MEIPNSNGKKALVVEDEPAISEVCRRVLAGEGLAVDIAVNGKIAQAMIHKKQYDILLVDMRTPILNGKELYQWLNIKYPKLASKVIFTTGDSGGDLADFLTETTQPLLVKPFTPAELRTIIRKILVTRGQHD